MQTVKTMDSRARGRNGPFKLRKIDVHAEPNGRVVVRGYSQRQPDQMAPLVLDMALADAEQFSNAVDRITEEAVALKTELERNEVG